MDKRELISLFGLGLGKVAMQLGSLTIFTSGVVNRKETSHKTLICVRPENPVLVPFDWTTTAVRIVQKQTVVLNKTDRGADLKRGTNKISRHSTEARRWAYAGRQDMVLFFRLEKIKSI